MLYLGKRERLRRMSAETSAPCAYTRCALLVVCTDPWNEHSPRPSRRRRVTVEWNAEQQIRHPNTAHTGWVYVCTYVYIYLYIHTRAGARGPTRRRKKRRNSTSKWGYNVHTESELSGEGQKGRKGYFGAVAHRATSMAITRRRRKWGPTADSIFFDVFRAFLSLFFLNGYL